MLGLLPRVGLSDWLVCRVADDADAHHSRHSHKQDPVYSKSGKSCADAHDAMHHGVRDVASVFSNGTLAGLHATALDVLADPDADAARLREPHANDKSLAASETLDLEIDPNEEILEGREGREWHDKTRSPRVAAVEECSHR